MDTILLLKKGDITHIMMLYFHLLFELTLMIMLDLPAFGST